VGREGRARPSPQTTNPGSAPELLLTFHSVRPKKFRPAGAPARNVAYNTPVRCAVTKQHKVSYANSKTLPTFIAVFPAASKS